MGRTRRFKYHKEIVLHDMKHGHVEVVLKSKEILLVERVSSALERFIEETGRGDELKIQLYDDKGPIVRKFYEEKHD